ncbi:hypothetical protein ACP4OV_002607 [Aristida adscensionis]
MPAGIAAEARGSPLREERGRAVRATPASAAPCGSGASATPARMSAGARGSPCRRIGLARCGRSVVAPYGPGASATPAASAPCGPTRSRRPDRSRCSSTGPKPSRWRCGGAKSGAVPGGQGRTSLSVPNREAAENHDRHPGHARAGTLAAGATRPVLRRKENDDTEVNRGSD